jgi:hypothetical protein
LLYRGCGYGCTNLLVTVALLLIILAILSVSQYPFVPGAIFIACGLILLLMLIIFLIRESMRHDHVGHMHDHWH